ncbi:MAG: tetratricopeptide repeat protein [Deltaproteobacteria bacterium]|nr:tetratricopeptide repeat protein [Deltaproteobacteria bacterium]
MAFRFCFISLILMLVPVFVSASPETDTPDLAQGIALYKAEDYEDAVLSLKKARDKDPLSAIAAYYLGLSYKQTLDYQAAITNLKDVLSLVPPVKEAHYELAEVYYSVGRYDDALVEIGQAEVAAVMPGHTAFLKGLLLSRLERYNEAIASFERTKSLDPSLSNSSNYQIDMNIAKSGRVAGDTAEKKRFRLTLNIGYEYDDNVVLKPSDEAVAAGITDEEDEVFVYSLSAEYLSSISGNIDLNSRYSFYRAEHRDLDRYDVTSHTGSLIASRSMGKGGKGVASLLGRYNYTLVDDDEYLHAVSISPAYSLDILGNNRLEFSLAYKNKDYKNPVAMSEEDRDSDEYAFAIELTRPFANSRGLFSLGYELSDEAAEGKNWDYIANAGTIGLSFKLTDSLRLSGRAGIDYRDFRHTHTIYLKKREEREYTFSLILAYDIIKNMTLKAYYYAIRSDANIAVYDYDRNISGIGMEIRL